MSSFPGQNGPVAPTPAAGGFAPVAPMHAAPQGFAPQPGGGFGAPPQAQPQYAPQPQAFGGAPQAQQFNAQPQATGPMLSPAEMAALRGAQMGRGKREKLPPGDYVCVAGNNEMYNANAGKSGAKPLRALAVELTVEESTVPTIRPGHPAKTSEFLDTDYDVNQQFASFKQFVGRLHGVQSQEQLDSFDWLTPVATPGSVFAGYKYSVQVRQVFDRAGRPKLDRKGQPVTRDLIQRIG
jgi:hypothetical protein